jgi:glycosyltransferase involved in cell wall biosynthesis
MTKIGIVTRKSEAKWGGDLTALYAFYHGLKAIDQEVIIGATAEELLSADFIFLSNTSFDLKPDYAVLETHRKKFGIIGFHSDRPKYYSPCYAFAHFVGLCLAQNEHYAFYKLEQLFENPDIIDSFSYSPPSLFEENYPLLGKADVCIATSPTEARTMQRDCDGCQARVVYLECGIPDSIQYNSSFLHWTGLKRGEYILQVGRIELRKNQLASILAIRDLDIPLVLIATDSFYPEYEKLCLKAIQKYRKGPTFVISQSLPDMQEGNLRILTMPGRNKLSQEMLISAYQNAGLHLHPAFCELPGLTYLEAAKLGVPTVASEWTTIKDYFTDPDTLTSTLDERIVYTQPHHINTMTELVLKQFGKPIDKNFDHPIFHRTQQDLARDLLAAISAINWIQ